MVDHRETLVTYLNSERNLKKTAEILGIGKSTLRSRIGRLRSLGVKVPKAQLDAVRLSKLEIAQLNSIIIKWQKEQNKEHLL